MNKYLIELGNNTEIADRLYKILNIDIDSSMEKNLKDNLEHGNKNYLDVIFDNTNISNYRASCWIITNRTLNNWENCAKAGENYEENYRLWNEGRIRLTWEDFLKLPENCFKNKEKDKKASPSKEMPERLNTFINEKDFLV